LKGEVKTYGGTSKAGPDAVPRNKLRKEGEPRRRRRRENIKNTNKEKRQHQLGEDDFGKRKEGNKGAWQEFRLQT